MNKQKRIERTDKKDQDTPNKEEQEKTELSVS